MPNDLGEIWGRLEQRLNDIDAAVQRIKDVDDNVSHVLGRLGRVEERLSAVEKTNLDTANAILELAGQIGRLRESVSGQVRHEVEKGLDATRSFVQLVDAAKLAGE